MPKYEGNSRDEKNRMRRKGYKLIATAKCDCTEKCGATEGIYANKVKGAWSILVTDPTGEYKISESDCQTLAELKSFLRGRYYGTHVLTFK